MKRNLWIVILLAGICALAGAAAAGAPGDEAAAPRDAAGLSGPRWGGGPCGPAAAPCLEGAPHRHAARAHGQYGKSGGACPRCGQACGHGYGRAQGPRDGRGYGPRDGRGQGPCGGRGQGPGYGRGAGHAAPRAVRPGARGGGFGAGPGFGPGGPMAKLDLSETQREKLADLRESTLKQNIQARADLRVAQMDLRRLMRAETPDGRTIEAQIDKLAGLRAAIQKTRVKALLDARSVLTPEQQKQLRERRGPGGGRGPGPWGWMDDETGPGGDVWDGPDGDEGDGDE